MHRRTILITLAIVSALAISATGFALAASANSDYEIDVVDAIDTPTETVEIKGSEYEIDEVAVVEPGDAIEADITSSENYYAILYNSDEKSEHREYLSSDKSTATLGDDDDDFDTSDLDPGTYMLSFEPDAAGREAVVPVVVQGYDISLEYPTEVEDGDDVEFEATVEPIGSLAQPDAVEVAIWDGSDVTDVTLDHTDGMNYETTVSLADLEPETYSIYGAVVDDETTQGYSTAVAVTDGPSMTVTSEDAGDGNDDNSSAGNGTDSGDGDETEADTGGDDRETEESINESDDGDADQSADEMDGDDGAAGTDDDGDNTASGDGDDGSETDDETTEVIEPNDSEETGGDDTPAEDGLGTPAIIPVGIAFALLSLAAVTRNRT